MFKFGYRSMKNLSECDVRLQKVFHRVIQHYDCAVIEGHRPRSEQDAAFHSGRSKVKWPNSKHNSFPSMAVDVVPWPVDWNDYKSFYFFAGIVKGIAWDMGINLRWGGDWDSDNDLNDQTFNDLPHFEILED